ncbi:MAG: TnpV protein [Lachnospira sp.]
MILKMRLKCLRKHRKGVKMGFYGRRKKEFLEEWHPDVLEEFEKNGTLEKYLESIDQTADAMRERLIEQITARDKDEIPDKELEPLKWARVMQGIAMEADSIVMRELILTL